MDGSHLVFTMWDPGDRRCKWWFTCEDAETGKQLASLEKRRITPAMKMRFMAECYRKFPPKTTIPGILTFPD